MAKRTFLDPQLGELTEDRLTRDYVVYQRRRGHRFSSDDMATAYVAFAVASQAPRIVDLGCGLGSVLLTLAWKMPNATLTGIEAQEGSFELLRRNVARNELGARVTIHHGDLRDPTHLAALEGLVPLVTGTPPYFPADAALDADDAQRAYARVEHRGGVEAYIEAAARLLTVDGHLVLCGDARADVRVQTAARGVGLHVVGRCEVIAQEGKPALFSVWTLARHPRELASSRLTLRDREGQSTPDARRLRELSGF